MAFADVEGAHIYLKQLFIAHHLASWESIQEIILRHYTRQLLHEMYKVNENKNPMYVHHVDSVVLNYSP